MSTECWCEHVDIGVGMQKVAHNDECPTCNDPRDLPGHIDKVVFGGDTHGDINQVRWLIDQALMFGAQAVFVLGDFGIWSHLDGGVFVNRVSEYSGRRGVPVYFLPGNHENYDLLDGYERDNERDEDGFVVLAPGVLYSPRGHRWMWGGVKFLSLGGAYSIDKQPRVMQDWELVKKAEAKVDQERHLTPKEQYALRFPHTSWWPQEEITDEERERAIEGGEVDVMLTHDKPLASRPDWNRKNIDECLPNQLQIQKVVDATRPKLLLHGHLHHAYSDTIESSDTFVKALDCDPEASRYSGGSGKRKLSYALLDLSQNTPDVPEPGPSKSWYTLRWHATIEQDLNRDFHRKGA